MRVSILLGISGKKKGQSEAWWRSEYGKVGGGLKQVRKMDGVKGTGQLEAKE